VIARRTVAELTRNVDMRDTPRLFLDHAHEHPAEQASNPRPGTRKASRSHPTLTWNARDV
jgi:hypothetical protein